LKIYLRSMIAYNVGVVCVFFGLAIFLWDRNLPLLGVLAALLTINPWMRDLVWFACGSKEEKAKYEEQLNTKDS
jgi:hypothetical protein